MLLIMGVLGLIMAAGQACKGSLQPSVFSRRSGGVSTAQLGHELYREHVPDREANQRNQAGSSRSRVGKSKGQLFVLQALDAKTLYVHSCTHLAAA